MGQVGWCMNMRMEIGKERDIAVRMLYWCEEVVFQFTSIFSHQANPDLIWQKWQTEEAALPKHSSAYSHSVPQDQMQKAWVPRFGLKNSMNELWDKKNMVLCVSGEHVSNSVSNFDFHYQSCHAASTAAEPEQNWCESWLISQTHNTLEDCRHTFNKHTSSVDKKSCQRSFLASVYVQPITLWCLNTCFRHRYTRNTITRCRVPIERELLEILINCSD